MSRELLLMRHGKAMPGGPEGDLARELRDPGKRACQRLGVWLWQQDLRPDHAVCSPAERALVSAEKCLKAMAIGAGGLVRDARLYPGSLDALHDALADVPADAGRVLLVGHKPGMLELVRHLIGSGGAEILSSLPTATLVHLRMPDDWNGLKPGCASLLRVQRGKDLEPGFPFPAPDGTERRDRPAYYYTQSAVIPYRVRDDGIEVLVVRSSKKNHWVVPKGVATPGESLQESAREEALEEAGVEGNVLDAEVGRFQVDKWGSTCTVSVFLMQVTRELPESEWEESHRGREWLPPAAAAARVRDPELAGMIAALAGREDLVPA